MSGVVVSVSCDGAHQFSKPPRGSIRLIEGLGVEGDAHLGVTVQHLSRIKRDPTTPNLRQVHLIHAELHDELRGKGFTVGAGDMGENVTTRGIDLLGLPLNARLHLGASAVVEVKGLRNPCHQIDTFEKGMMHACLDKDADGSLIRKAGIMGIVIAGGEVRPGDAIRVVLPDGPQERLLAI
ncbi:MAG TPA: MOSC domain-containing protein [Rhizomicrobium sp.]|jgi:MOSC domain-containing protein YiiM|nr:MOSC domain-containing protein [Rhizomicrobium sp.]